MYKNLTITSFIGVLTIILGAFGAHALKKSLTIEDLNSFETAIRYQMYHVIVLLFVNTYKGFSDKKERGLVCYFLLEFCCFLGQFMQFI